KSDPVVSFLTQPAAPRISTGLRGVHSNRRAVSYRARKNVAPPQNAWAPHNALPVLDQRYTYGPAAIRVQDVISGRIGHARSRPVFKRGMFAGGVLHKQLNGEPLQVIVRRRIARVVAER